MGQWFEALHRNTGGWRPPRGSEDVEVDVGVGTEAAAEVVYRSCPSQDIREKAKLLAQAPPCAAFSYAPLAPVHPNTLGPCALQALIHNQLRDSLSPPIPPAALPAAATPSQTPPLAAPPKATPAAATCAHPPLLRCLSSSDCLARCVFNLAYDL